MIAIRQAITTLAMVTLLSAGGACSEPRFNNCADPGAPCHEALPPAPPAGAKLINDFESAPAATTPPLGCTSLFAGERCTLPLRNQLGLCADSLFCAFEGSICGAPVTEGDAFRGQQSWRLRFNESVIRDASSGEASAAKEGSTSGGPVGYPFSGYSERLSSALLQGSGCGGSLPPLDASSFSQLTFWMKAEDGVDFEMALKSDRPTPAGDFQETFPKPFFGECKEGPESCICGSHGAWKKVCIPLTKLLPTVDSQVNLHALVEFNIAFAASPYVINRNERGAAEITIDDLAFEP